jgi:hypothetical protein
VISLLLRLGLPLSGRRLGAQVAARRSVNVPVVLMIMVLSRES